MKTKLFLNLAFICSLFTNCFSLPHKILLNKSSLSGFSGLFENSTRRLFVANLHKPVKSTQTYSSSTQNLNASIQTDSGISQAVNQLKMENEDLRSRCLRLQFQNNVLERKAASSISVYDMRLVDALYNIAINPEKFAQTLQASACQISGFINGFIKSSFEKRPINLDCQPESIKFKISNLQGLARIDRVDFSLDVDKLLINLSDLLSKIKQYCYLVDINITYDSENSSFVFQALKNPLNINDLKIIYIGYKEVLICYLQTVFEIYSKINEHYKLEVDNSNLKSFLHQLLSVENQDDAIVDKIQTIANSHLSHLNNFLTELSNKSIAQNDYQLRLVLSLMTVFYSPLGSLVKSYEKIIKLFNDSFNSILDEHGCFVLQVPESLERIDGHFS